MTKNNLIRSFFAAYNKKAIPLASRLFAPVGNVWNRFIPNLRLSIKDSAPSQLYITPYDDVKFSGGIYHVQRTAM